MEKGMICEPCGKEIKEAGVVNNEKIESLLVQIYELEQAVESAKVMPHHNKRQQIRDAGAQAYGIAGEIDSLIEGGGE